jgi:hypothetical protein
MNTQEAFTAIVEHLRKQGCRSQQEDDAACLYRGPKGLRCAVGALIPDELYEESMEGINVASLLIVKREDYPKIADLLGSVDISMLEEMQNIHDFQEIEDWENRFRLCAKDYGLTFNPSAG